MRSSRITGIIVIASLLLTAAGGSPGSLRAASAAVVRVDTSADSPMVGDIITVSVRIRRAEHVGSVPFMLTYDPRILELVAGSSREGSFLRAGNAATAFIASAGRAPGGITGVNVGLARLGARRGARGRGLLCTFKFRARSPGTSALGFTRSQVLDPEANPLDAVFRGTVVTVRPVP